MTLPIKDRRFDGGVVAGRPFPLSHFRDEFHCFEVSQVAAIANDRRGDFLDAGFPSVSWSFLPAPRTWVEWSRNPGERVGVMLVENGDWAGVYAATQVKAAFCGAYVGQIALEKVLSGYLLENGDKATDAAQPWLTVEPAIFREVIGLDKADPNDGRLFSSKDAFALLWQVYALLLLINTPKVVERTTHDPHRGLAREILSRRKTLGIFPLQAWTEIVLPVSGSENKTEPASGQTGLTGMMPLHWTRAHKKRVHGVWTLISDYWSGDGSLGIKRSRYTVTP
jgi:hypothetical protein